MLPCAMLEHLMSPEWDDVMEVETPTLLSAQAQTATFLQEMATPAHILEEDEKQAARDAFAYAVNPNVPDNEANRRLLKLRTPEAVKHLAGMLTQYDWDYVEQAKEIRGYVVAKLMEETKHPDAKIRLKSLELVGKLTEIGSFQERITITKVDATTDELQDRIRSKLAALLPKVVEVETLTPKE